MGMGPLNKNVSSNHSAQGIDILFSFSQRLIRKAVARTARRQINMISAPPPWKFPARAFKNPQPTLHPKRGRDKHNLEFYISSKIFKKVNDWQTG